MLLTAGLAAGQAQATNYQKLEDINALPDETVVFDGTNDRLILDVVSGSVLEKNLEIELGGDSSTTQYIVSSGTASASAVTVLNGNGKNITITGTTDADAPTFSFGAYTVTPKLQIKDLGTLTIAGAKVNLETPASGTNTSNNQVGVDVGAQNIRITDGAQVNLNNNTDGNGNRANTILRGFNMEISGEKTVVNVGNTGLTGSDSTKNTKAVLGWQQFKAEDGTVDYEGSNIKVSDGATINLTGIQVEGSFGAQSYHPGYTARVAGNSFRLHCSRRR